MTEQPDMKTALLNKIYEHIGMLDNRSEEIDRLWNLNNAEERDMVLDLIIEANGNTMDHVEIKKCRDQGCHSLLWTIVIGAVWDNLHCYKTYN